MHQLRWHALLKQWVVFNTDRQNRPQMPANWCPFDPGSGKVPDHYDVHLYANDFPGFSPLADPFVPNAHPELFDGLFDTTGARGACDVVLYSPEHTLPPSKLSHENWRKVVDLWTSRTLFYSEKPDIAMVAIFENCGEAVGVTMPHPHGQIYAMPFVSPVVEKELEAASEYQGGCLFCDLLAEELKQKVRLIAQDDHFVAFVPYAARFPAEVSIYSRRHVKTLLELSEDEKSALASIISTVRKKYDNLYGFLLPLMMAVKQAPLRQPDAIYHFHIQFLPLQRSVNKLKYLATIETGFGSFLADTSPEEMAKVMRECEPKTHVGQ